MIDKNVPCVSEMLSVIGVPRWRHPCWFPRLEKVMAPGDISAAVARVEDTTWIEPPA
jgi:hypothetical protein